MSRGHGQARGQLSDRRAMGAFHKPRQSEVEPPVVYCEDVSNCRREHVAPVPESRTLPEGDPHLIGIGGYGMRGLARLLAESGRCVTGSDSSESSVLRDLRNVGIRCWRTGDREVPAGTAWIVYSAAVPPSHRELRSARKRRLRCLKYAEALGRYCAEKETVACGGTHGKSTTTALLAFLLRSGSGSAGYLVGADPPPGVPQLPWNAAPGDPMVVEACEYDRSFLNLSPACCVITNIEKEHVDCFSTEQDLRAAFGAFVERVRPGGVVIVPKQLERFALRAKPRGVRVVTFGPGGQWHAEREGGPTDSPLRITGPQGVSLIASFLLPGRHNLANLSAACAVVGELYGEAFLKRACRELGEFQGLRRRLEIRTEGPPVIIDDYAHHPTEIEATLCAVKERCAGLRGVIAVFEPHQQKRLEAFWDRFRESLRAADFVVVVPVFTAREAAERSEELSRRFVRSLRGEGIAACYCSDHTQACSAVLRRAGVQDVVVCLGAGRVTEIAEALAEKVNGRGCGP